MKPPCFFDERAGRWMPARDHDAFQIVGLRKSQKEPAIQEDREISSRSTGTTHETMSELQPTRTSNKPKNARLPITVLPAERHTFPAFGLPGRLITLLILFVLGIMTDDSNGVVRPEDYDASVTPLEAIAEGIGRAAWPLILTYVLIGWKKSWLPYVPLIAALLFIILLATNNL